MYFKTKELLGTVFVLHHGVHHVPPCYKKQVYWYIAFLSVICELVEYGLSRRERWFGLIRHKC